MSEPVPPPPGPVPDEVPEQPEPQAYESARFPLTPDNPLLPLWRPYLDPRHNEH